jgi:hypothetical protein
MLITLLAQATQATQPTVLVDPWSPDRILNLAVSLVAIVVAALAVGVSVYKAYQAGGLKGALDELSRRLEGYQKTNSERLTNNANHAVDINNQVTNLAKEVGEAKGTLKAVQAAQPLHQVENVTDMSARRNAPNP